MEFGCEKLGKVAGIALFDTQLCRQNPNTFWNLLLSFVTERNDELWLIND